MEFKQYLNALFANQKDNEAFSLDQKQEMKLTHI